MLFKVGDKVWWESQAQASWKRKEGVVVEVLPPRTSPSREKYPDMFNGVYGPGSGRTDESYVVAVEIGKRVKRVKHYWPHASKLNLC